MKKLVYLPDSLIESHTKVNKYFPKYFNSLHIFQWPKQSNFHNKIKKAKIIRNTLGTSQITGKSKIFLFTIFQNKTRTLKSCSIDPILVSYFPNLEKYPWKMNDKISTKGLLKLVNIKRLEIYYQVPLIRKSKTVPKTPSFSGWHLDVYFKKNKKLGSLKIVIEKYDRYTELLFEKLNSNEDLLKGMKKLEIEVFLKREPIN